MRIKKLVCDICEQEILDEEDNSTIHFEFTENHFHCEDNFPVIQEVRHYDLCRNCIYKLEDIINPQEIMFTLKKRIKMAKEINNNG